MPCGDPIRSRLGRALVALRREPTKAALPFLFALHAGLLAWGAARHSPTIDEPVHLAAGIRHWQTGQFDGKHGNPPLVRLVAAAPVMLAGPVYAHGRWEFPERNGSRIFRLVTMGRWACIPFSLLGGYICFRWATDLYGRASGLTAATLWCFDPFVLSYGQLITADAAAASFGLAALYCFWKWLQNPSVARAAVAGVVLGFVHLTKYVWIIMLPLCVLLWIGWQWAHRRNPPPNALSTSVSHLFLMILLCLYVVNLGYGFADSFQPFGDIRFRSQALQEVFPLRAQDLPTDRTDWWGSIPMPLPLSYINGPDAIAATLEGPRRNYLNGEWREGTWPYYFLYGLAVKLPLGTLVLVGLACVISITSCGNSAGLRNEAILLVPLVAMSLFVSWATTAQFIRYILPAVPFAFVFASKVGLVYARRSWWMSGLVSVALAWTVVSSTAVYPHTLSYFNELAGGPTHGHAYLVDCAVDWGQDLLYLKRWVAEHPEARPLRVAYFGVTDPRAAGIEFSLPPNAPDEGPMGAVQRAAPGWYAVSVNLLRGYEWRIPDGRGGWDRSEESSYTHFLELQPVAMAGYSIYIYCVPESGPDARRSNRSLIPADGREALKRTAPREQHALILGF